MQRERELGPEMQGQNFWLGLVWFASPQTIDILL